MSSPTDLFSSLGWWTSVDPGANGGVADWWGGELMAARRFTKTKGSKLYTSEDLEDALDSAGTRRMVIELPFSHVPAGQSATTAVTSNRNWGVIVGWMVAMGCDEIETVSASAWKKRLGLGKDKKQAQRMAAELYPKFSEQVNKYANQDGAAEAVLIGHDFINRVRKGK